RRITDQMIENWMTGGGVPLTKAARQPAMPTTTPESVKTTTLWTGVRRPTASAPSGWWPVRTHCETRRVRLTYQTRPLTARQVTPATRYTARLVLNQPLSSGCATPLPPAPPVSWPMGKIVFSMPIWATIDTTVKYRPLTAREPRPVSAETTVMVPTATAAAVNHSDRPPFWATKAKR